MSLNGIFGGLHISASGMRAQRVRQNTITSNLANAETTRTSEGGPYRKQFVVFQADQAERLSRSVKSNSIHGSITNRKHLPIGGEKYSLNSLKLGTGVKVAEIRKDDRPPQMVYKPDHPDANAEGYVAMPNVNIVEEMADMISATRAYEANVTAFNSTKSMLMDAINL